jgi:transposase
MNKLLPLLDAVRPIWHGEIHRHLRCMTCFCRAIADAKIKTDKVDATVLAQLLASGFLPEVWLPDEETAQRRRQVARRAQLVRQRTQVKNQIHAILHRNLLPLCPYADLFGKVGRTWLATQPLPADEQQAVDSLLRTLEQFNEEVAGIERDLAEETLGCVPARWLMTIPGVDTAIAMSLVAAIGEIARFGSSQKLVSYLGLDPRVRQSGLQPAAHGRISKQGRAHARGMLVEAAWAVSKTPGPLRAFFLRLRARRGEQIAVVATARKLAVLVWHLWSKEQDYLWARPSLTANKLRKLELRAGQPARRCSGRGRSRPHLR